MKSQVTTKQGDAGQTGTLGGSSVPKSHPIIECVGALDELRAHTALLRLQVLESAPALAESLLRILHLYFLIGAACSDPSRQHPEYRIRDLSEADLEWLEQEQQRLEAATPLPQSFIASAATLPAAQADITATIARRFERTLVRLKEQEPGFDCQVLLPFSNRLGDFLYVLARHLEHPTHLTLDDGAFEENP